ncbi:hypothetical protein AAFF_G00111780 [Aldrovandia affinis]|uniref:Uncharacterized protein n=1 Tax=Aldrovandia affinis TaxID=143900 RepID=A0AAD7RTE6_9TELE|nr:hypothetical protein AAFF_G00111780 [Aldrovandia affinis]
MAARCKARPVALKSAESRVWKQLLPPLEGFTAINAREHSCRWSRGPLRPRGVPFRSGAAPFPRRFGAFTECKQPRRRPESRNVLRDRELPPRDGFYALMK